jgi:hypothetical protein
VGREITRIYFPSKLRARLGVERGSPANLRRVALDMRRFMARERSATLPCRYRCREPRAQLTVSSEPVSVVIPWADLAGGSPEAAVDHCHRLVAAAT